MIHTWCNHIKFLTLLFLVYTFSWNYSSGQSTLLSGKLVDSETGKGISYATLRLEDENIGTITNINGEFSWAIPANIIRYQKRIYISSIGYKNKYISWSEVDTLRMNQFTLIPQAYALANVYIYASDFSPRQMLKKALKRISINYCSSPYILQTFYRHYCKENNEYGRLIEAGIDIYDSKGHNHIYSSPSKKVNAEVKQLRRSFDFTRFSALNHAPISLHQTLHLDVTSYKTLLRKYASSNKASLSYKDTTVYDGQTIFVIEIDASPFYRADVYITAEELAILKVEEQLRISRKSEFQTFYQELTYRTEYRKYGEFFYLNHIINEGQQLTTYLDSAGERIRSQDHFHHVELMVNNIKTENPSPIKGMSLSKESLNQIPYRPDFWNNYTVLKATPLEGEIERDLAERFPLDTQFRQINNPGIEIEDYLLTQSFNRILEENINNHVLVYVWRSGGLPKMREVLLARKLVKSYRGSPVAIIFLSLDEDEEAWRKAVALRKMYLGYNFRMTRQEKSRIAQKYGITSAPHYLVIGPGGKTLLNTNKLPDKNSLQEVLKGLLIP